TFARRWRGAGVWLCRCCRAASDFHPLTKLGTMSRKQQYLDLCSLALTQRWLLLGAFALTGASALVSVLKPWPLKILADLALGQENLPDSAVSVLQFAGKLPQPWVTVVAAALAS